MTGTIRPGRTAGFTLYGVIIAILLFGIALHPLVSTLASNTRIATDREERLQAERVLRNELAVLAVADPAAVDSIRTYRADRADRAGRVSAGGRYEVVTRRSVRCSVGGAPWDNTDQPAPSGCPTGGVVHDYSVTVTFPRSAGSDEAGSITRHFAVGATDAPATPVGDLP